MKNNIVIKPISAIIIFALFLAFIYDLSAETLRSPSYCFLIICTLLAIIIFRKNLPQTPVFYTMLTGMFLKLTYVIYTPVWCRQHDVVDFGAGEGHAAYMEYILEHSRILIREACGLFSSRRSITSYRLHGCGSTSALASGETICTRMSRYCRCAICA